MRLTTTCPLANLSPSCTVRLGSFGTFTIALDTPPTSATPVISILCATVGSGSFGNSGLNLGAGTGTGKVVLPGGVGAVRGGGVTFLGGVSAIRGGGVTLLGGVGAVRGGEVTLLDGTGGLGVEPERRGEGNRFPLGGDG